MSVVRAPQISAALEAYGAVQVAKLIEVLQIQAVTAQHEAGNGAQPMKVERSTSNRLCPCLCMVSR